MNTKPKRHIDLRCPECGIEFARPWNQRAYAKYCSRDCRNLAGGRTCGQMRTATSRVAGHERAHRIWGQMIGRCTSPGNTSYYRYGGRGITVCERWRSFSNFLADMGDPPATLSLDRIDNDGNYELSNCRWATNRDQCRNKRTNRIIAANGKSQCLIQWAEETGIKRTAIEARLALGWSPDRAINTPVEKRNART